MKRRAGILDDSLQRLRGTLGAQLERRDPPEASEGCAPERKVGGNTIRKISEKVKGGGREEGE
jgi:hypothetical protein